MTNLAFTPVNIDPAIETEFAPAPMADATWYRANDHGASLHYTLARGGLSEFAWLSADFLLDGVDLAVFRVVLGESQTGRTFAYRFGLMNQIGARLRLPLAAVDQSRWQTGREGALLKPMCAGDAVNLAAVDRLQVMLEKTDGLVRFCMTPLTASVEEPPVLTDPVLPAGPLLDDLGQSILRDWPTKSSDSDAVSNRMRRQLAAVGEAQLPEGFSSWGGWQSVRFEATGFFRTHHDGTRWWLVDPDGQAFWSMGVDCVRDRIPSYLNNIRDAYSWLPDPNGAFAAAFSRSRIQGRELDFVDFLRVNLIRAFGEDWHDAWSEIALAELRRIGFNTVANWSEWEIARAARVPYVRPLAPQQGFEHTPMVFRDFPDVYDASFPIACAAYAQQLEDTRGDPAQIGYFLMNEPTWGFAGISPAEGMLRTYPKGPCRTALAEWLRERYVDEHALAAAWQMDVTFDRIAAGPWVATFTDEARKDLESFGSIMVEMLFGALSKACRAVDPDHLNLGARYYTFPPAWMVSGMRHFDVFSINGYKDRFPGDTITELSEQVQVPIMIGEWHFGALDVGLPGGSLRRVDNQHARGEAYRVYAEGALAHPACVGIHWFTLYDESPMGRFDGENWNTGFLDVCHRPYEELATAARLTHERMYRVALGTVAPYDTPIDYRRNNIL